MPRVLRTSDEELSLSVDPETGFMHVKGTIARTGLQEYYGYELGNEEAPMEVFNVYRPKEEVLNPESLESYKNATVTDDHPVEFVNINNHNDLSRGSMASVETFEKDGIDYIKTDIIITNQNLIEKAQNGKIELSVGYTQDLLENSGEFMGVPYQYVQTNIRANHIAVVAQGRCGSDCRLSRDLKSVIISNEKSKQEVNDMVITIGGKEFDVPEEVAEEVNRLTSLVTEKEEGMEDMEEKVAEAGEKTAEDAKTIDTMQATIDSQNEKIEKTKSKMTDADMQKLVDDRAQLIVLAKDNDVTADASMCSMDIKKAILEKHTKVDVKDKADAYVDARFDIYLEDKAAAKESIDSLAADIASGKQTTDEATSRNKRIKANQNKFKQPGGSK